jgi:Ca2+-binding EF-hand superfamily protein
VRNIYSDKLQDLDKKWFGPAKKFSKFSKEDVEVFIVVFRHFDEYGEGSINSKGLGNVLSYMGQGASDETVRQLLKTYDADGSGVIEWEEFLQVIC